MVVYRNLSFPKFQDPFRWYLTRTRIIDFGGLYWGGVSLSKKTIRDTEISEIVIRGILGVPGILHRVWGSGLWKIFLHTKPS